MTPSLLALIVAAALLTYATRVGGYLLIARLRDLPPRLEAALEAMPAAVITALAAPAVFSGSWREAAALAVTVAVGLRAGPMLTIASGTGVLIALRALAG